MLWDQLWLKDGGHRRLGLLPHGVQSCCYLLDEQNLGVALRDMKALFDAQPFPCGTFPIFFLFFLSFSLFFSKAPLIFYSPHSFILLGTETCCDKNYIFHYFHQVSHFVVIILLVTKAHSENSISVLRAWFCLHFKVSLYFDLFATHFHHNSVYHQGF